MAKVKDLIRRLPPFIFGLAVQVEPIRPVVLNGGMYQNFEFDDRPAPSYNRELVIPDMMTAQENNIWLFPHQRNPFIQAPQSNKLQTNSDPGLLGQNLYNIRPANGVAQEFGFDPLDDFSF